MVPCKVLEYDQGRFCGKSIHLSVFGGLHHRKTSVSWLTLEKSKFLPNLFAKLINFRPKVCINAQMRKYAVLVVACSIGFWNSVSSLAVGAGLRSFAHEYDSSWPGLDCVWWGCLSYLLDTNEWCRPSVRNYNRCNTGHCLLDILATGHPRHSDHTHNTAGTPCYKPTEKPRNVTIV